MTELRPKWKCDFCARAAVAMAGEWNHLLVCDEHDDL